MNSNSIFSTLLAAALKQMAAEALRPRNTIPYQSLVVDNCKIYYSLDCSYWTQILPGSGEGPDECPCCHAQLSTMRGDQFNESINMVIQAIDPKNPSTDVPAELYRDFTFWRKDRAPCISRGEMGKTYRYSRMFTPEKQKFH